MVAQFGLAMILSPFVNTLALIPGTTNFLVGSMRHADELSTTVIPASAHFRAHSKDVSPPAEHNATSGFISPAVCKFTTLYFLSLKAISLPTDFSDATGINSVTGKLRSAKTFSITSPTIPVAPTTATFIDK